MEHNSEESVATRLSLLSPALCPALPHEGQCFWLAAAPGSPPGIWLSSCHHRWEVCIALSQLPFSALPLQLNILLPRFACNFLLAHPLQCTKLMLTGDFSLIFHFPLLDTYFPSFSDNGVRSHCCNESLFHNILLQLPQLNADRFSNTWN